MSFLTVLCSQQHHLDALLVHDAGTRLVVLVLGDPHLLEGGEPRQNGSTNPDGVLALGRGKDLHLHGGGSKSLHLLGHALSNALEHGGTTGQHNVAVQVRANIDIALHDGVEGGIVDTGGLLTDEGGLEEGLRAAESLASPMYSADTTASH